MPGLTGNQASSQYWNASGEATPSAKLPEKYESTPVATSPIADQLTFGTDFAWTDAPVVHRAPRMNGFRRLYHRGMTRMPITRNGGDGPPYPYDSSFQPRNMGPIRNGSFNDALYQAGYGGYNLGLSFKVPTLDKSNQNAGRPAVYAPININVSKNALTNQRRATGAPSTPPPQGSNYGG